MYMQRLKLEEKFWWICNYQCIIKCRFKVCVCACVHACVLCLLILLFMHMIQGCMIFHPVDMVSLVLVGVARPHYYVVSWDVYPSNQGTSLSWVNPLGLEDTVYLERE